eukprot:GHRQ01020904.1.p1 GENE.GHRQ01020904.1~~GHRQ01020904.1.p1  ORF type:complete len:124 (+),score=2.56 GHRQ01020904.1:524-895(+)
MDAGQAGICICMAEMGDTVGFLVTSAAGDLLRPGQGMRGLNYSSSVSGKRLTMLAPHDLRIFVLFVLFVCLFCLCCLFVEALHSVPAQSAWPPDGAWRFHGFCSPAASLRTSMCVDVSLALVI